MGSWGKSSAGTRELGEASDRLDSWHTRVSRRWDAEVVVAGGGPAGVCAAVAAGRMGASVILVERYGFLGGNATGGLVGPFSTTHFAGKKVVAGLVDEIIDRLTAKGGSLGTQRCPYPVGTTFGTGGWITTFEPEALKTVLDDLVREAGVKVLFHTRVIDVDMCDQDSVGGLLVHSKSGCHVVQGSAFVDATGDGDVAAWAGAPWRMGDEIGLGQPATLMLELCNVDLALMQEYMVSNPEEFAWQTFPEYPLNPSRICVAGSGFVSLIRDAKVKGKLKLGRNRITFFSGVRDGRLRVNATRVSRVDATDVCSLSSGEVEGRIQAASLFDFMRECVPGCQRSELVQLGCYLGIRESRRVVGRYVVNRDDVISGQRFPDSIGCGAYPVDLHRTAQPPPGEMMDDVWIELEDAYDIPYRCLLPCGVEGLLVAGRPISVTHEAMASTRLMVHCMVTGQATGVAAALGARTKKAPHAVPVREVQRELLAQGAYLRCPETAPDAAS